MFAGGGNRCVWQAGFYRTVAEALGLAPARAAAASAGAAVAAVLFAGRFDAALAHFKRATAANRRNVHWANLFNGAPVFPHAAMYRRALLEVIDDRALATLHAGPDLRVPITRAPRWLGARTAFAVAGLADACRARRSARRCIRGLRRGSDFAPTIATVRDCRTPEALADLVLASSCTPPFTPLLRHGGKPALDGGIADNVPVDALAGRARPRRSSCSRGVTAACRYTSRGSTCSLRSPVPVSSWDYTNPAGLQAALRPRAARWRELCAAADGKRSRPWSRHERHGPGDRHRDRDRRDPRNASGRCLPILRRIPGGIPFC